MTERIERMPDSIPLALQRSGGSPADAAEFAGAFPILDEAQLAKLRPFGKEADVAAGEVLFREGQLEADCVVVLSGELEAVAHYGATGDPVSTPFKPGQFVGVMNILSGEGAYVTVTAKADSHVLRIPLGRLREVMGQDVTLSEIVLRAFLLRHSLLMRLGTGPKVIGSRFQSKTRDILDLLARNRVRVTWLDVESNPGSEQVLRGFGFTVADTPVVLVAGQPILRNPSLAEVSAIFGITPAASKSDQSYDVIVVGAGPGGLAAAVYAGSEGLSTVVIESIAVGGQAGTSSRIENYLGFPAGLSGQELAARAALQAQKFTAAILVGRVAGALRSRDGLHTVELADGRTLSARAIVVATGARYRRLSVARLREFEGSGVYYAATEVEARACTNRVAVVGGGNSAGQAAIFLARKGLRVDLLIRGTSLDASMSRYLIDEIAKERAITVRFGTQVAELVGDQSLQSIVVEARDAGRSEIAVSGLFSFIGADPNSEWLDAGIERDPHGFILTGSDVAGGGPLPLETSRQAVFAVGDVRHGSIKRVATAVGEGAMAVRLVHERLSSAANVLSSA